MRHYIGEIQDPASHQPTHSDCRYWCGFELIRSGPSSAFPDNRRHIFRCLGRLPFLQVSKQCVFGNCDLRINLDRQV